MRGDTHRGLGADRAACHGALFFSSTPIILLVLAAFVNSDDWRNAVYLLSRTLVDIFLCACVLAAEPYLWDGVAHHRLAAIRGHAPV
jgi:hypothetical protein